jgi:hypothetical protein
MNAHEARRVTDMKRSMLFEKQEKQIFLKIVNKLVPAAARRGQCSIKLPCGVGESYRLKEKFAAEGFMIEKVNVKSKDSEDEYRYLLYW